MPCATIAGTGRRFCPPFSPRERSLLPRRHFPRPFRLPHPGPHQDPPILDLCPDVFPFRCCIYDVSGISQVLPPLALYPPPPVPRERRHEPALMDSAQGKAGDPPPPEYSLKAPLAVFDNILYAGVLAPITVARDLSALSFSTYSGGHDTQSTTRFFFPPVACFPPYSTDSNLTHGTRAVVASWKSFPNVSDT